MSFIGWCLACLQYACTATVFPDNAPLYGRVCVYKYDSFLLSVLPCIISLIFTFLKIYSQLNSFNDLSQEKKIFFTREALIADIFTIKRIKVRYVD